MLALGATIAVVFGIVVPAAVSSGAERLGGLILIALGVIGLWGMASGRAYGHIHRESDGRSRWHVHVGHPSGHPARARPLAPAGGDGRDLCRQQPARADAAPAVRPRRSALALPVVLLLVVLFGLGILLSMSLFGVLLARVLSIRAVGVSAVPPPALVAIASIALGGVLGIDWSEGRTVQQRLRAE